jgi:hypothetical protein
MAVVVQEINRRTGWQDHAGRLEEYSNQGNVRYSSKECNGC